MTIATMPWSKEQRADGRDVPVRELLLPHKYRWMYPEYTAQTAPPAIMTVTATRASTEARSAGPRSSTASHHGLPL